MFAPAAISIAQTLMGGATADRMPSMKTNAADPLLGQAHQAQHGRHEAADDEHRHDAGAGQRARDQHQQRQHQQQQPLPPVQADDERPHQRVHGAHLRVGVHEHAGGDEDEGEVEEGERALDEQVRREAEAGHQRADHAP